MSRSDGSRTRWYLEPDNDAGHTVAERLYPRALRRAEELLLGGRSRREETSDEGGRGGESGRTPRIGVGLSGGGIRSATLSLGFFQGMARRKLLRHVDVISTVSGGGYFGAFYGHLLRRARKRAGGDARGLGDDLLTNPSEPAVRFLRDNGRYLAPEGAGDLLSAAAAALRNWVSVLVVLILPLLVLFSLVLLAQLRVGPLLEVTAAVRWWVSPFLVVAALAFPLFAVPPGWAYWLVRDSGRGARPGVVVAKLLAPVAGVGLGVAALLGWVGGAWLSLAVGIVALLTLLRFAVAARLGARPPHEQRNALTRGLKRALSGIGVLLLLGVIDTVARVIVLTWGVGLGAVYGAALAAVGVLRAPLLRMAAQLGGDPRKRAAGQWAYPIAAGALGVLFLGGVAAVPHMLTWTRASFDSVTAVPTSVPAAELRLLTLAGVAIVLSFATGRVWSFVNRSSMHALYEARLRRAYLGASNPKRQGEGEDRPPLTEAHPDDGMGWAEYAGLGDPESVAHVPIHLINVTVNETVDGRSQVEQRDRKGAGLAVGPCGVSLGRTHHALWAADGPRRGVVERMRSSASAGWWWLRTLLGGAPPQAKHGDADRPEAGFRVFPARFEPEMLDVGQWVAISGGAVSTGLGARTSLALSLLCGFFNIRLGYWWRSGVDPTARDHATRRSRVQVALDAVRAALPVQAALADEWLARFPGTARTDWYLTDGGHFENLAGYELIRRRLPLIVLCDHEQDADYAFPGLANLVRKARTDLAADIDFLDEEELEEAPVGRGWSKAVQPLQRLRRGEHTLASVTTVPAARVVTSPARDGLSLGHAAVARITYHDYDRDGKELPPTFGMLVYVKATLDGDEPVDLREYHRAHPDFPHESTGDQFFDEAQWESYRKLGEHLAERVFASGRVGGLSIEEVVAAVANGGPTPL